VIGGGVAGLLTARVLSDHFGQVTILEQDLIDDDRPAIRKSIPQGHHLHGLLEGGLRVLSSLYPSFTEDLRVAGATRAAFGRDVVWYLPDGKAYNPTGSVRLPFDSGPPAYCASRGLIELAIRRRTMAIPNVRLEGGAAARELICRDGRIR